jgi:formylglycine-generating enzyme required for sulfatase activity
VKIDGYTDGVRFTAKVGSYTANRLGIYDMGGGMSGNGATIGSTPTEKSA